MESGILGIFKFFMVVMGLFWMSYSLYGKTVRVWRDIDPVDDPGIISAQQPLERNLFSLDAQTPRKFALSLRPWANGPWKIDSGILGARYADERFKGRTSWRSRFQYMQEIPMERILRDPNATNRQLWLDVISPAEKYDLLVGDREFSLTRAQWAEGERYWKEGVLAHWMGICEGTAAASVFFPEPRRPVDLVSPNGEVIRFHVMDIKGLAGLVWSSYNAKLPTAGTRCPNPQGVPGGVKDAKGVVIDEGCFNSNPGSFHIAVLNFLSLRKTPFFINRETKVQVWNSPVIAYDLRYFNPRSGIVTPRLNAALAPLSRFPQDRFKFYRSPRATQVVGVEISIKLAKGSTTLRDSGALASISELKYVYDLELDADGAIVGGEWHSDLHPDFMWAVEPGFKPLSVGDLLVGDENWAGSPVPSEWLSAIRQSSARNQPLYLIVKKLIEFSAGQ